MLAVLHSGDTAGRGAAEEEIGLVGAGDPRGTEAEPASPSCRHSPVQSCCYLRGVT